MSRDRIEQARREAARWSILQTTHIAGHVGATDEMILPVLRLAWPEVTTTFLHDQIDYLERRELVTTVRDPIKPWRVRLTRDGQDLVEYTVECEPGIARPPKYWSET